jgi:hypothetical protein
LVDAIDGDGSGLGLVDGFEIMIGVADFDEGNFEAEAEIGVQHLLGLAEGDEGVAIPVGEIGGPSGDR